MPDFTIKNNTVTLRLNPRIYPIDVIYSASYIFIDKAYIFLDGEAEKEIIISIEPKTDSPSTDPEKMAKEYLNELINYADYKTRAEQTKKLRHAMLERALITNDPSLIKSDPEIDNFLEGLDDEAFDDPEGIAVPWEEKYGRKTDDTTVAEKEHTEKSNKSVDIK